TGTLAWRRRRPARAAAARQRSLRRSRRARARTARLAPPAARVGDRPLDRRDEGRIGLVARAAAHRRLPRPDRRGTQARSRDPAAPRTRLARRAARGAAGGGAPRSATRRLRLPAAPAARA